MDHRLNLSAAGIDVCSQTGRGFQIMLKMLQTNICCKYSIVAVYLSFLGFFWMTKNCVASKSTYKYYMYNILCSV